MKQILLKINQWKDRREMFAKHGRAKRKMNVFAKRRRVSKNTKIPHKKLTYYFQLSILYS